TVRFQRDGYESDERETHVPPPGRPDLLEPLIVALRQTGEGRPSVSGDSTGRMSRAAGQILYTGGEPAKYLAIRIGNFGSVTDAHGRFELFYSAQSDPTILIELPDEPKAAASEDSRIIVINPGAGA